MIFLNFFLLCSKNNEIKHKYINNNNNKNIILSNNYSTAKIN